MIGQLEDKINANEQHDDTMWRPGLEQQRIHNENRGESSHQAESSRTRRTRQLNDAVNTIEQHEDTTRRPDAEQQQTYDRNSRGESSHRAESSRTRMTGQPDDRNNAIEHHEDMSWGPEAESSHRDESSRTRTMARTTRPCVPRSSTSTAQMSNVPWHRGGEDKTHKGK